MEIFDRRSLRLSAEKAEMVALSPEIVGLPEDEEGAALLIECRGPDEVTPRRDPTPWGDTPLTPHWDPTRRAGKGGLVALPG